MSLERLTGFSHISDFAIGPVLRYYNNRAESTATCRSLARYEACSDPAHRLLLGLWSHPADPSADCHLVNT